MIKRLIADHISTVHNKEELPPSARYFSFLADLYPCVGRLDQKKPTRPTISSFLEVMQMVEQSAKMLLDGWPSEGSRRPLWH